MKTINIEEITWEPSTKWIGGDQTQVPNVEIGQTIVSENENLKVTAIWASGDISVITETGEQQIITRTYPAKMLFEKIMKGEL